MKNMSDDTFYKKVMIGKKTTYQPVEEYENTLIELEQEQVISLLTTFTLSMLMSVSSQLVNHSRAVREIKKVEEAVVGLARLNPKGIDSQIIDLGTKAWNAAICSLSKEMK